MYINGKKVPEEVIKLASLAKTARNVSESVTDKNGKMFWEGKQSAYERVVHEFYAEFFSAVSGYIRANPNEYSQDESGVCFYFSRHYVGGTEKKHLKNLMARYAIHLYNINHKSMVHANSEADTAKCSEIKQIIEDWYGERVLKSVLKWLDTLDLSEHIPAVQLKERARLWLEEVGING